MSDDEQDHRELLDIDPDEAEHDVVFANRLDRVFHPPDAHIPDGNQQLLGAEGGLNPQGHVRIHAPPRDLRLPAPLLGHQHLQGANQIADPLLGLDNNNPMAQQQPGVQQQQLPGGQQQQLPGGQQQQLPGGLQQQLPGGQQQQHPPQAPAPLAAQGQGVPGPPPPVNLPAVMAQQQLDFAQAIATMRPSVVQFTQVFSGKPGEDAVSHMYAFRDWIVELQTDKPAYDRIHGHERQVELFKTTLRGDARLWIENLRFATIEILQERFLQRWSKTPTRDQDISSLGRSQIKPGESVNQYTDRMTQVCGRIGLLPDLMSEFYMNGLPPEMQLHIKACNVQGFPEMKARAREYERMTKSIAETPPVKAVTFSVQECPETKGTVDSLCREMADMKAAVYTMRDRVSPERMRSLSGDREPERRYGNPGYNTNYRGAERRYDNPSVGDGSRQNFRPSTPYTDRRDVRRNSSPGYRSPARGSREPTPERRWSREDRRSGNGPPHDDRRQPSRERGDGYRRGRDNSSARRDNSGDRARFAGQRGQSPRYFGPRSPSPRYSEQRSQSPRYYEQRGQSPRAPSRGTEGSENNADPLVYRCYACNKLGHLWRNCPHKTENTPEFRHRKVAMRQFLQDSDETHLEGSHE